MYAELTPLCCTLKMVESKFYVMYVLPRLKSLPVKLYVIYIGCYIICSSYSWHIADSCYWSFRKQATSNSPPQTAPKYKSLVIDMPEVRVMERTFKHLWISPIWKIHDLFGELVYLVWQENIGWRGRKQVREGRKVCKAFHNLTPFKKLEVYLLVNKKILESFHRREWWDSICVFRNILSITAKVVRAKSRSKTSYVVQLVS